MEKYIQNTMYIFYKTFDFFVPCMEIARILTTFYWKMLCKFTEQIVKLSRYVVGSR